MLLLAVRRPLIRAQRNTHTYRASLFRPHYTYSLLLGEFSKRDCRRIFPKGASKQYLEKFQAVLNALEVVSSPACTITDAEKASYVQIRIALSILKEHELKGLRIDAA